MIDLDELEKMLKKKPLCTDDIMDILCTIPAIIAENRALRERVRELDLESSMLLKRGSLHDKRVLAQLEETEKSLRDLCERLRTS